MRKFKVGDKVIHKDRNTTGTWVVVRYGPVWGYEKYQPWVRHIGSGFEGWNEEKSLELDHKSINIEKVNKYLGIK